MRGCRGNRCPKIEFHLVSKGHFKKRSIVSKRTKLLLVCAPECLSISSRHVSNTWGDIGCVFFACQQPYLCKEPQKYFFWLTIIYARYTENSCRVIAFSSVEVWLFSKNTDEIEELKSSTFRVDLSASGGVEYLALLNATSVWTLSTTCQ